MTRSARIGINNSNHSKNFHKKKLAIVTFSKNRLQTFKHFWCS